jgi:fructose-1,6-bisphosphatase II
MKHISLDLVRVTEAAAIAASAWIGSGNKELADRDATEAMRSRLNKMEFAGRIRIGEGKKDQSFGLFKGEEVGALRGAAAVPDARWLDIAVDPIDGTTPTVTSGPEAISVLGVAEGGAMLDTDEFYMHKLAYGPRIAQKVRLKITDPLEKVLRTAADAAGKDVSKIMVCILNRPRHAQFIKELRQWNVRIKLIQDCDVSGAIATCLPESGIDLLYGIGGAPESVITACAMKCLKGDFQAQIAIATKETCSLTEKVYGIEDLARGHCAFAATGITAGSILRGVRFTERGPVTNSVFMRSESGTVRWITTEHGN